MARFKKGADAFAAADAARTGGSSKFTPFVKIAAGEKKYLQFVTPLDEITSALIHQYVIVGYKENGDAIYANFVSPRDSMLEGPSGYDQLQERFDLTPTLRLFGVAVELEPTYKTVSGRKTISGFEPKMRTWTDREDNEHETLVAGIVVQAKANFWGHLQTWAEENDDDITGQIWAVSRDENTKQPTYSFVANQKHTALDLSEWSDDMPDQDAFLEEIADPDRMEEMITPLPDDFKVSRYQKRKEAPAPKSNTKSKAKAEPVEEEEEEFESNEEKEERQSAGVGRLRARINKASEDNDDE